MIKDGKKYCPKCDSWKELSEFYVNKKHKDGLNSCCKSCQSELSKERRKTLNFPVSVTEKLCPQCGKIKPAKEFYKDKSISDGLKRTCKFCDNLYYIEHKEERKIYNKKYQKTLNFPVSVVEKKCSKCGKIKPVEEFWKDKTKNTGLASFCILCSKESRSNYYLENKEILDEYQRQWRQSAIGRISTLNSQRKADKKQIESGKKAKYERNKSKNDPNFKIKKKIKNRVNKVLKIQGAIKEKSIFYLLGCNINELKEYLESQFQPGMTWENHGTVWHIDHILPISKFDLKNIEHQKICFHFLNLQPLWAEENMKKGEEIVENAEYLIDAILEARKHKKVA